MKRLKQDRHQLFLTIDAPPSNDSDCDGFELRLDRIDINQFARFRQRKPEIITLAGRFDLLGWAIARRPYAIDLDLDAPKECVFQVKHAGIRLILSQHTDRGNIRLDEMRKIGADIYKVAKMVNTSLEAFEVLRLSAKDVIAIPMGQHGSFGRILAPVLGQPHSYTSFKPFAPGQLTPDELKVYHFRSLGVHTRLYGLIGDPIDGSPSHVTHNRAFRMLGLDAVYVKMKVGRDECAATLKALLDFGFEGLSVTMPLKQLVIQGGVFNTLKRAGNGFVGLNTDGAGALDAIEKRGKVKGMRMVILGQGGCAKAIAKEANARGAVVEMWGREKMASEVCMQVDWLVQATPLGMKEGDLLPIDATRVQVSQGVLETIHTISITPFLQQYVKDEKKIIKGQEMFSGQAMRQFLWWL